MPGPFKILFLSTHEWSDLWRRRQRIAYELSLRQDVASVLFVNPPVQTSVTDLALGRFQASHLGNTRREHARALLGVANRVADRVWVYTGSQKTLPLSRFDRLRRSARLSELNAAAYAGRIGAQLDRLPGSQLLVYLSHPLHAFALDAFKARALACYDWTDDWMEFELLPLADREEYAALDRRLPREADLVFAVSRTLFERARALNEHAHWLPNATSLMDPLPQTPGADPEIDALPRPRLGYVGHIGDRVDFALLEALAQARPDCSLVMIGPVWSNRKAQADALAQLPNVHFLGPRPYNALPAILGQFDVCLIPHTRDQLTLSMDPIKLYDYLSCGKPIITTPVAGVERFADVLNIEDSASAFIAAVGSALSERDPLAMDRRREHARQNAWPARTAELWSLVLERLGTAATASTAPQHLLNTSFRGRG